MSTKTPFAILFGGADRSALDLPVAGLAGLAVAFAMFTIPDDLLAEAVGATGIANLIAAAQPPLGTTARIVLASAGAITAFFGAFLLLRWLDRFALRSPAAAPEVLEGEGPRIRRSDAHPDAPPCRPISASRDLGEPAPPSEPIPARHQAAGPGPQPEAAIAAAEPPPRPIARGAATEPAVTRPPLAAARSEARPVPQGPKAPAAAAPAASQTLSDLMARLEHGLARRERAASATAVDSPPAAAAAPMAPPTPTPAASPAAERPAAPPPPTPSNDRLQNAIDGLRALSVRV